MGRHSEFLTHEVEWLEARKSAFFEAQDLKRTADFWTTTISQWFEVWPLPEGLSDADRLQRSINIHQVSCRLSGARLTHHHPFELQRIKYWFYNHGRRRIDKDTVRQVLDPDTSGKYDGQPRPINVPRYPYSNSHSRQDDGHLERRGLLGTDSLAPPGCASSPERNSDNPSRSFVNARSYVQGEVSAGSRTVNRKADLLGFDTACGSYCNVKNVLGVVPSVGPTENRIREDSPVPIADSIRELDK